MIKIENTEVMGFEAAIRGMRNPMNSWDKSDSYFDGEDHIGDHDIDLMKNLASAGTDHSKYRRMITVYADITAPLYWWKEADTYKIGTVANSCSTMHKIHAKKFEISDFSHEHLECFGACDRLDDGGTLDKQPIWQLNYDYTGTLLAIIKALNGARDRYISSTKARRNDEAKKYWWQMIQLLPSSYNQKRTIMLNYEVLANQYKSRKDHKLDEWREYCSWIESLPYAKELII